MRSCPSRWAPSAGSPQRRGYEGGPAKDSALGPLYGPRPVAWPSARALVSKRRMALGPTQLPTTGAPPEPHARRTQVWDWRGLSRPGKTGKIAGHAGSTAEVPITPPRRVLRVALGPYAADARATKRSNDIMENLASLSQVAISFTDSRAHLGFPVVLDSPGKLSPVPSRH